jgi:hypothetical protein
MERFTLNQSEEKKMFYMNFIFYFINEYFKIKNELGRETEELEKFGDSINSYSDAVKDIMIFDQSQCDFMDNMRKTIWNAYDAVINSL